MSILSADEIDFFNQHGYLLLENAVTPDLLAHLKAEFQSWVDSSRTHDSPYGECIDGRARFDLEPGHTADSPALRRINAPVEISEHYLEAMRNSRMTDAVAELIGPNVKFHHSKVNSKLPDSGTVVKWHQDFPFTPHSNDDMITALLMIDDVTQDNGPLEVLPGSHRGELHSLWQDGRFSGSVTEDIADSCAKNSVFCTGAAGSACLMHTRLLHGSAINRSSRPRTLFICVYTAEDAIPCSPNPMPSRFEGEIVRGKRTGRVRAISYDLELPEIPKTASFFDQQRSEA